MPLGSVIIPTLGRKAELQMCLESLWAQSNQDFEIIQVTEEGPLAKLRNQGARRASGTYLIFIDDDTIISSRWFESICAAFARSPRIGGVSGPSFIRDEYRHKRDMFRYPWIKFLYDQFFLEGLGHLPGHFTKAGAWTTGACNIDCSYEGPVQYLEACNMAFHREAFEKAGGFCEDYVGIGDWSEPDLAFRVKRLGYDLWFARNARVEHRPSTTGAFKKRRADAPNRMLNYGLFSSKWVKPYWKHTLYKKFMRTYYALATLKR